jgi:hypothetical protein
VRFHGQLCQAMARGFEQGGQRTVQTGDVHPESLFLRGIQQQSRVGAALVPVLAGEAIPIENVGRGPCSQALGLARAMEGGNQGARRGRWP